ncbi:MAG TPA: hypothetical protein VFT16_03050 [Candidatus Saccharimonadales bacterium]|nr:hypothetical protein [Candidatus Saccharimonadales bacterium]
MEHDHEQHQAVELVSRQMQIATVAGNLALGAVETVVSAASSAISGVSDGVHNILDGITYWKQFDNLRGGLTEEQRMRNRQVSYWLLSAASVALSAKAGVDFLSDHEAQPHPLHIYAAAGSLALNGAILGALANGARKNRHHGNPALGKDISATYKHFIVSDMPSSAIAVFGAFMYKQGMHNVEQLAAVSSSLLTAWFFRPTKKNVAHEHSHFMVCGHDHDHRTKHTSRRHRSTGRGREPQKTWRQRMAYKPRHAQAGNQQNIDHFYNTGV